MSKRKRRPPSCHKSRNTQNLTQRGLFAILSGAEGARTRFCYDTSVNTNAMNAVWGLPHEQEKKKSSDLHSPDPNVSATTNAISGAATSEPIRARDSRHVHAAEKVHELPCEARMLIALSPVARAACICARVSTKSVVAPRHLKPGRLSCTVLTLPARCVRAASVPARGHRAARSAGACSVHGVAACNVHWVHAPQAQSSVQTTAICTTSMCRTRLAK